MSVRALVVDDSQFMRTVITDALEDAGIEVVAQARNGAEAVDAVREHEPDVVTMDVEMPEMDGIEAVEEIMESNPTPILMLSAHTEEGADSTFEALEKGAVDFLAKPGGEVSIEVSDMSDQLAEKVRAVAEADVSRTSKPTSSPSSSRKPSLSEETEFGFDHPPTVIIGASTGGPRVLERVLRDLPRSDELRVLVVQHMPDDFTGRFADRLDSSSEYVVKESEDRDFVKGGEVVVAKGDHHTEVVKDSDTGIEISLNQDPKLHGVRPSIDITMKTAADKLNGPVVAVLLTGMGKDGVAGARAIDKKASDSRIIAQDEATSHVFGIPARTIESGVVDEIVPDTHVASTIFDSLEEMSGEPNKGGEKHGRLS